MKRKTGGPLSLLQVKKRLFRLMKSEIWSLLANEINLFFRKWGKKNCNDL